MINSLCQEQLKQYVSGYDFKINVWPWISFNIQSTLDYPTFCPQAFYASVFECNLLCHGISYDVIQSSENIKMTTKNLSVVIFVCLKDLIFFADKYSFNSLTDFMNLS